MTIRFLTACIFALVVSRTTLGGEDPWKPVSPEELGAKESTVEKDADAEILFKEVHVDLSSSKVTKTTYVRIKIFTERGARTHGTVELRYVNKDKIEQIAGRTIKPDGSTVELRPEGIFDREIVKVRGFRIKVKSFAMPAVEPGAILEYRWRESEKTGPFFSLRLDIQDDIPARAVTFSLKVSPNLEYFILEKTFNAPEVRFLRQDKNVRVARVTNVLASRDEPLMPPENQVRSWILVYYEGWAFDVRYRRAMQEHLKAVLKPSEEVRSAALEIIGDASTPNQKLERLFRFCLDKIRNVSHLDPEETNTRTTFKENKTPTDTLKQRAGTGEDINLLFAALAGAAGFNPHVAQLPDRSDIFFDPTRHDLALSIHFLSASHIAVDVNGAWRFFDPASRYVPYGMLRWQEEGGSALLYGVNGTSQVETPISPPYKSLVKRKADLRLSEDGVIEGDVRVEHTGHPATVERLEYASSSAAGYEESLRKALAERLVGAEVSAVRTENFTDTTQPFVYSYHVKMPGYAQRTGRRLFLKPAFFQHGKSPLLSVSERKHAVYFQYPWSEYDAVTIGLPAGYTLESEDAPGPLKVGALSEHKVTIRLVGGRRLEYSRAFYFGGGGVVLFPATAYSELKRFFDFLHERDNHIMTLKPGPQ